MKSIAKFVLMCLLGAFCASIGRLWWDSFVVGRYYVTAGPVLTVLVCLVPLGLVALFVFAMKLLYGRGDHDAGALVLFLALGGLSLGGGTGCSRAQANVQTLVTGNCGVSWDLIPAGQSIPVQVGPCSYRVTVPDYPMQGDTKFKTSFKNRVLAGVEIGYEYMITDAKMFISEAKYLGKPNSEAEDTSNAASMYENAENAVIDKRIREATSEMLITEDIVDFSQAEFEDKLLAKANEMLQSKGVQLNFISFVPTPEQHTREAIDILTAMRVYEGRNLSELGQKIAVARAGSAKIEMNGSEDVKKADNDK